VTGQEDTTVSRPAGEAERLPAAERLLGLRRTDAAWFLRRLQQDGWRDTDLWCRRSPGGPLTAAGLITEHPGRTATLSVSACHDPAQVRESAHLLLAMLGELARRGHIALAQGMTTADDPRAAAPFIDAGFLDLAVLSCMERGNGRQARRPEPPAGAELVATEGDHSLQSLLRATYEDTLDCPGLADLRRDDDILEGHRRGGRFDPSLWTVLRVEGREAGAALLNRSSAGDSVELTYLGLAKWARGKGFGALLLDAAIWKASSLPDRLITLAVDERNTPAERLYRSRGFRTVARRRAFARRVDSST
jgi:ribosomal protein S18 acetylase RimI-like enzyme